jgi:hypothetical protein
MIKNGFLLHVLLSALSATVNFFTGTGIGGTSLGLKYAGYSLALSVYFLSFTVPVLGLVAWYNFETISVSLMLLLGITSNVWIDLFVNASFIIVSVTVQIVISLTVIFFIVEKSRKKGE